MRRSEMISKIELEAIVRKIIENSSAKEIILFISHIKGNETEDSDIDLLLYTVDEFREKSQLNITFENEIKEKGIKIYG